MKPSVMNRNSLIDLFRWILVLPGSILGGILMTFPLHWLTVLLFSNREFDLFSLRFFLNIAFGDLDARTAEYILYPFVIAVAFILFGYKIAPRHKFKVAVIIFLLYFVSWSVVSTLLLSNGFGQNRFGFSGRTILALSGAVVGLLICRRKDQANYRSNP